MYRNPYQLFGRLSMEMMRAVRLVVDTGIHAKGWSIEEAIDFMAKKTGMHHHECEAECFRYEAWPGAFSFFIIINSSCAVALLSVSMPGQACAYKVGEIAIWRMRREAEATLGEAFDLRRFHSVLLDAGPTSLDVLSQIVQEWTSSC